MENIDDLIKRIALELIKEELSVNFHVDEGYLTVSLYIGQDKISEDHILIPIDS